MSACARDEELLLAEALERALRNAAEPTRLTTPALAEVLELIALARRVEASARTVEPSAAFREAARARLVASMRRAAAPLPRHMSEPWRPRLVVAGWFTRAAGVLSALALAGAATASASANALPGDPYYAVKQTAEHVALETATDAAARRELLLRQAHTRLDETSRLLEQGRDSEASQDAVRYAEALDVAAVDPGPAEPAQATLQADHTRLARLLEQAPPAARPGLLHALAAAERRLARAPGSRQPDVEDPPSQARPTVVQPASDISLEPTPTSPATRPLSTAHPRSDAAPPDRAAKTAEAVRPHRTSEPGAEQAPHENVPDSTGAAARRPGLPERPTRPDPGVERTRGAPINAEGRGLPALAGGGVPARAPRSEPLASHLHQS